MSKQLCYAACSFGLEAVVARQLEQLGLEEVRARDARVYFHADEEGIARANLWLSAADRVYLVLSEFPAATFEGLFQGVKAIAWILGTSPYLRRSTSGISDGKPH